MSDSRLNEAPARKARPAAPAGGHASRGFSLIELLVSMTIGLVITVAAFSAYLGTSGASRMAEAQARMNEDGQAALAILSQQLRMAGNNPNQPNRLDNTNAALSSRRNPVYGTTTFTTSPTSYTLSAFSIRGCDGTFSNVTTAATLDALGCAGTASSASDALAINYEADRFNTSATTGGAATDCLGNQLTTISAVLQTFLTVGTVTTAVPSTATFTVADNRFYVGTSTAIVTPSLYCKGNGGASTAQPLVENIEDLQLTYGTASPSASLASGTATVAGYLRADEIASLATSPANDATRWSKVLTVRICVVVRSENPVVANAASASYLRCDGTLDSSKTDLRLRRAYASTVVLRNRRL